MLVHRSTQTSCLRRPLISCIPEAIRFCNYSHRISNNNRAKSQFRDISSKSILTNKFEEGIRPNSDGRNDNNRSGKKPSELSKNLLVSTLEKLEKYIVDQAQHNKVVPNGYATGQSISLSSLETPTSLTLIEPLKVNQLSDVRIILKSDSQKVDFLEVIKLYNTRHTLDINKALKMYIDKQLSPFQQIQLMNMLIAKHNFTNAAIILNNLKLPIDDTITILQRLMKKGLGSKWAELQFLRNFQKFCSSKALLKQVDSSIDISLLDLLNTLEEKYTGQICQKYHH